MKFHHAACTAVALLSLPTFGCVGLMPTVGQTASDQTPAGKAPSSGAAPEPVAGEADEAAAAASTPSADEGAAYVPEGKNWQPLPLAECLPAYRQCLEQIPEDERGQLGLSYKHHQMGLKFMESGKIDSETATKQCNGWMTAFTQGNKC